MIPLLGHLQWTRNASSVLIFLFFCHVSSWSAPVVDSLKVEEKTRSLPVAIVAWPFEKILQPAFGAILYPFKPPLDYVIQNNLIQKGMDLITLGEQKQIMLYPTFNLKPGTNSSLGVTYRHWGLLMPEKKDYLIHIYTKYVNDDWDYRLKYSLRDIAGISFGGYTAFRYKQDRDGMFVVSEFDNTRYQYTDSSWDWRVGIGNQLTGNWSWGYSWGIDRKKFGKPTEDVRLMPTSGDSLLQFDPYAKGFYQHFWQYPISVQLTYNARNFSSQPTQGQFLRMDWTYVPVSEYATPGEEPGVYESDHNYSVFSLVYQNYLLIGKKQYRLSRAESRANQKYLESMSLEKTMKLLSPQQIKETLLERKVLAFQFRMRQLIENQEGMAPFNGYSELNSNTPLRGYDVNYFDYNLYSASLEYRWPIVDLVDGVLFNEYALVGKSWRHPEWENLRNSWGFGIRVSKPKLFLSRLQIGFHGHQGINLILTINPEFQ